jgi:Flp pilus assembly protein TadB
MGLNVVLGFVVIAVGFGVLVGLGSVNRRQKGGFGGASVRRDGREGRTMSQDALKKQVIDLENKSAKAKSKNGPSGLSEKERLFFQAGYFSEQDREDFYRGCRWAPLAFGFGGLIISLNTVGLEGVGLMLPPLCAVFGTRYGQLRLESEKKSNDIETLFYLPIVIEQLVIGVSSALDIGPCIKRVLEMAADRDRQNPVILLLEQAMIRVRAGQSLDEALVEVGELRGLQELSLAFNAIGQSSRHGGEVARQLQELSDGIIVQREAQVEGMIKALEVKATLPVALAFIGFLALLFTGVACSLAGQM